jgi:hypothetical protein
MSPSVTPFTGHFSAHGFVPRRSPTRGSPEQSRPPHAERTPTQSWPREWPPPRPSINVTKLLLIRSEMPFLAPREGFEPPTTCLEGKSSDFDQLPAPF